MEAGKAQEMKQSWGGSGGGSGQRGERWSELPEPLIDRVIARLPLSRLFQARTLCKRWNSCFLSQEFRSMFAERSVQSRYLGLFVLLRADEVSGADGEEGPGRGARSPGGRRVELGRRDSVAYDFVHRRWQKLPPPPRFPHTLGHVSVTGAGGLLLFSYVSREKRMLHVVCNPLSGQVRELPDTLHNPVPVDFPEEYGFLVKEYSLLRMIPDKGRNKYWIVVVDDDDEQRTHVFESTENVWAVAGRPPLHPLVKCSSAYCNGILYCLGMDAAGNCGIMSYDVRRRQWDAAPRIIPRERAQSVTNILDWEGHLLFVLERDEMPANLKHISVFKWDPASQSLDWDLVAEMPFEVCGPCGDSFMCVADKERLFFSRIFVGSLQMAVYNFGQDSWERLLFGPYLGQGWAYQLVRFPFEPDWMASV